MSQYTASEDCISDGVSAAQELLVFVRNQGSPAARRAAERLDAWVRNAEQYIDEGVIDEIERDAVAGELFDEVDDL